MRRAVRLASTKVGSRPSRHSTSDSGFMRISCSLELQGGAHLPPFRAWHLYVLSRAGRHFHNAMSDPTLPDLKHSRHAQPARWPVGGVRGAGRSPDPWRVAPSAGYAGGRGIAITVNRFGMPTATELQSSNDLFFPLLAFPSAPVRCARIRDIGYGVRSDCELNFGRHLPTFGRADDDDTDTQPDRLLP